LAPAPRANVLGLRRSLRLLRGPPIDSAEPRRSQRRRPSCRKLLAQYRPHRPHIHQCAICGIFLPSITRSRYQPRVTHRRPLPQAPPADRPAEMGRFAGPSPSRRLLRSVRSVLIRLEQATCPGHRRRRRPGPAPAPRTSPEVGTPRPGQPARGHDRLNLSTAHAGLPCIPHGSGRSGAKPACVEEVALPSRGLFTVGA
jgi:ribosomal protein L34E